MKWPFVLRSTHERALAVARQEAEDSARNSAQLREAFDRLIVRCNLAELTARQRDAAFAVLVEPAKEVVTRCSRLSTVTLTGDTPPGLIRQVVVTLEFRQELAQVFRGYGPIFGWCLTQLVHHAVKLLDGEPAPAPKDGGVL